MRRKARIDANQPAIVKQLRKAGLSVAITSSLGKGFPDLVVGGFKSNYPRFDPKMGEPKTVLIELKDPSQPLSARRLTRDEAQFHADWKGEIYACETAEEILRIFGLI